MGKGQLDRRIGRRGWWMGVLLAVIALLAGRASPTYAANYTVNNAGDEVDINPGDNLCKTINDTCTLRAAIDEANAHAGPDTITFNIGTATLTPGIDYATLTDDGTTIRGADNITIDGTNAPFPSDGITISASNVTIQGLRIYNFRFGVYIDGQALTTTNNLIGTNGDGNNDGQERNTLSDNMQGVYITGAQAAFNVIAGNRIGTNPSGSSALPNLIAGIEIAFGAHDNLIGTDADGVNDNGERNIISGNGPSFGQGILIEDSDDNVITGNYIGLAADGNTALPNQSGGIVIIKDSTGNRIGTNADGVNDAAERNVISGNEDSGIGTNAPGNAYTVIAGNYIGTNASGVQAVPNSGSGISLHDSEFYQVGTNGDGINDVVERNIISGNAVSGIHIQRASHNVIAGNYIGLNSAGSALGNSAGQMFAFSGGIVLHGGAHENRIGTNGDGLADVQEANVISNNGKRGIYLYESINLNSGNVIAGNIIGANATGTLPMGNEGPGISMWATNSANSIGGNLPSEGNLIAYNDDVGIGLAGWNDHMPYGTLILHNSIHDNGGIGIDLGHEFNSSLDGVTPNDAGDADLGPNFLLNYPVLTSAVIDGGSITIDGEMVDGLADSGFLIHFYASSNCDLSGYGEGETFLGVTNTLTDSGGDSTFSAVLDVSVSPGMAITATASRFMLGNSNTSEFSACIPATSNVVNLLSNPGFESDEDDNNLPDFWIGRKLGRQDLLDCSLWYEGGCSFILMGNGSGKSLKQVIAVDGSPNDEFDFSLWVKAQGADGSGNFQGKIVVYYTDGTKETFSLNFTKGSYDWQMFSKRFSARRAYSSISIELLYGKSRGQVWFDQVALEQVP
jgi:parallel beta-helix repeat protein